MQIKLLFIWLLQHSLILGLPFQLRNSSVTQKRKTRSIDTTDIDCKVVENEDGIYRFVSDGTHGICGLFLISSLDEIIEVEFLKLNIGCDSNGLLAVVDGWEYNQDFFPSNNDHALPMSERYTTMCGRQRPTKIFMASQNVALIQSYIPTPGEGFTVKVKHIKNPKPCNVLQLVDEGIYTLKNYGERKNCSFSLMYPENIRFLSIDVGMTGMGIDTQLEIGTTDKCVHQGNMNDYVEVLGGNGFGLESLNRFGMYCGLQSSVENHPHFVGCQQTVVRMVSSGQFYNTVTFMYLPPTEAEMALVDPNKCYV